MHGQYRREPLPPRTCPGCGATFQPSRVTHEYCTKACGKRAKYVPSGPYQGMPVEDRFWRHVDRSGGPDACWPWTGATVGNGYGTFGVRDEHGEWGQTTAHRVALELTEGHPLAPGEVVCHRCDNPPCCNPAHLFRGSQTDNMDDMREKGRRGRTGPRGSGALTEETVREIRRLGRETGATQMQLAARFGVNQTTISRVLLRQIWRHVE